MNQNRNQNRRRGRGSNRGGQGGGHQSNRIDSRARGNAPQMLEKYKKLAHDASLNGDRVLTEYYLQFADHYFRVVADSRAQKEEGRPPRRDQDRDQDREQSFDSDDEDSDDRDDGVREEQPRRRHERNDSERSEREEGQRGVEGDDIQEATAEDNPFVRDTRRSEQRSSPRGRGRGRAANAGAKEPAKEQDEAAESAFDPGALPPSIAREEEAPRPTRSRTRRARPADDAGDETLEAVS